MRQPLSAGAALIPAQLLYPVEGILVDDRLMGVLEHFPLRWIVGNDSFQLALSLVKALTF